MGERYWLKAIAAAGNVDALLVVVPGPIQRAAPVTMVPADLARKNFAALDSDERGIVRSTLVELPLGSWGPTTAALFSGGK